MRNSDLIVLDLKSPPQRIQVTVPRYEDMFSYMSASMKLFAASMRDTGFERIPDGFDKMLSGYYEANEITKIIQVLDKPEPFEMWIGNKCLVLLTGGKDSVMLLIDSIKLYGQDRVIGFYVDGMNRSESVYERESARRICEMLDVRYIQGRIQLSGMKNRAGHLIGLRDQLLLSMATMYARREGASILATGLHYGADEQRTLSRPLWGESKEAIGMWTEITHRCGFQCVIDVLNYTELDTIDKIAQHPDILALTSSCYTQKNFRENQHARMKTKYPDSWLHPNGCGVCIKCLRINGTMAVQRGDKQLIEYVMGRYKRDYPDDGVLEKLNERIQSHA